MGTAELLTAVHGYARRIHATIGAGHHVASPLGAWLVLAIAARTSSGPARAELGAVLGMDPAVAADAAVDLLARPHPLVHAAASAWRGPAGRIAPVAAWLAALPDTVRTGDATSQSTLDEWAREHTHGLIDRFPLVLDPDTVLIVASALASKVTWQSAFDIAPAERLGPDRAWRVPHVLTAEQGDGHAAAIVQTRAAGDVIVHVADATGGGLRVVSVAAAPEVPAGTVLDVAHEVADRFGRGAPGRSLFDLPLGETPLWRLTETAAPSGRHERLVVHLPAWTARSDHDLTPPELGLSQAGHALGGLFGVRASVEARQAAYARFGRFGFEAAAVTALAVARGGMSMRRGRRRTAELRFAHPYAVVAVATGGGRWHGLPVFSAWVAEADPNVD